MSALGESLCIHVTPVTGIASLLAVTWHFCSAAKWLPAWDANLAVGCLERKLCWETVTDALSSQDSWVCKAQHRGCGDPHGRLEERGRGPLLTLLPPAELLEKSHEATLIYLFPERPLNTSLKHIYSMF